MEDVYQDLNTLDLWVGGLAEDHEDGSELGQTFRTYEAPIFILLVLIVKTSSLLFMGKTVDR